MLLLRSLTMVLRVLGRKVQLYVTEVKVVNFDFVLGNPVRLPFLLNKRWRLSQNKSYCHPEFRSAGHKERNELSRSRDISLMRINTILRNDPSASHYPARRAGTSVGMINFARIAEF